MAGTLRASSDKLPRGNVALAPRGSDNMVSDRAFKAQPRHVLAPHGPDMMRWSCTSRSCINVKQSCLLAAAYSAAAACAHADAAAAVDVFAL